MGTVNYDLGETRLAPGLYGIDAVIRACNASGCSAQDPGAPMVHCSANLSVQPEDVNKQLTVVYKDRERTPGCGFAISSI